MIIAISGKIGSGKDTVGKIIQYLDCTPKSVDGNEHILKFILDDTHKSNLDIVSNWQIKKFADKIKDIVCILLSCTRQQLEDREFKEKELGEEWRIWYIQYESRVGTIQLNKIFSTKEEAKQHVEFLKSKDCHWYQVRSRLLTPRLLLQLIGTDCGRDIIHPNIWVNALMNEYKGTPYRENWRNDTGKYENKYPNWIITDLRFPNELKAIKDRGGITIRVNRIYENPCKNIPFDEHESETALDNAEFDELVDNSGTIEELIEQIKKILIKRNII